MSFIVEEKVEAYAKTRTSQVPDLLTELEAETFKKMEIPQMITGVLEGRFLKLLVQMLGAKRILEIGTFTGYSALSMAEGLSEDGKVITCEVDGKNAAFAQSYFDRSPHGKKIELKLGSALETMKSLKPPFDLMFIDADKENYPHYYEASFRLLRSGGFMVLDNMLWSGTVLDPKENDAKVLSKLNQTIAQDKRVENVLLTVRDGVQLVRKK